MDKKRILIADDQPDVLEALRFLLKAEGYQTDAVSSPGAVVNSLETRDYDSVIMDLNYTRDTTSGEEGLDLLSKIQSVDPTVPVIVMTAWGSVELACRSHAPRRAGLCPKAMGQRAADRDCPDAARVERGAPEGPAAGSRKPLASGRRQAADDRRIGRHAACSATDSRVGPSDANVLITGEPGSGKEVVARTLHAISERASKPLVTVNAGGLSEGIFESELFGHVKGAFTDAKADRVGPLRTR
jgi:DNA-binding NtrC family response regulator